MASRLRMVDLPFAAGIVSLRRPKINRGLRKDRQIIRVHFSDWLRQQRFANLRADKS